MFDPNLQMIGAGDATNQTDDMPVEGLVLPHGQEMEATICIADEGKPEYTTTPTVLDFLLATDEEIKTDAWNHLVKIFFCCLRARPGSPRLFLQEDGENKKKGTQRFLEEWLAAKLKPFYGQSKEAIQAAADVGAFQYWGWECRCDLIDKLRKLHFLQNDDEVRREVLDRTDLVRLDVPVGEDGLALDVLVTSEGSHHIEREDLLRFIADNQARLPDVVIEMTAFVDVYFPEDDLGNDEDATKGDVTERIAELRHISERQPSRASPSCAPGPD
jgi:hypothetical protein